MFLSAIRHVQDIQLVCFAVVFGCMVAQSKRDHALRLMFYNYLAGLAGAIAALPWLHIPPSVVAIFSIEVAQIRYALLHLAVVSFVGLGGRTRWIGMWMALGCLPFYWMEVGGGAAMPTYQPLQFALAVQTALTAWLLWRSRETVTRAPRMVMGSFLLMYSAVEIVRLTVTVVTKHDPSLSAPGLEQFSIVMYVVASSLTPLAFLWLLQSRLLGDLKRQSVMDPLTGLLNRRGFEDGWMHVCESYKRTGRGFALAVADIDHFKKINDTYGHANGDIVLCGVANVLRTMVRESDLTGRLGGEEFIFVLREVTETQALVLVERIRKALEEYPFRLAGDLVHVSASFGVTLTDGRQTPSLMPLLLHEADSAMYQAKAEGRNQTRIYAGSSISRTTTPHATAVEGDAVPYGPAMDSVG